MSSPTFNVLLKQLISLPAAKREEILSRLQKSDPEGYKKLNTYFKVHKGAVDEALGYDHWLRKLGAQTFTRPFAPVHKEFWAWNWETLMKIQDGISLSPQDLVAFIPWAREYGKP